VIAFPPAPAFTQRHARMSDRKISVLLPCYNQARYLPQAIESVLTQQNADWELLISDDASTDNSAEIIRSYAARDPRIHFHVQSPNLGMAANWNWCLEQTTGHYIKFLFGDDYFCTPDTLAQLSRAFETNPQAVIATSARLIVDENARTLFVANELNLNTPKTGEEVILRCLLEGKNLIGEPSAVMFRREAAKRGFDPSYRQLIDWEFWAYLLEQGELAYVEKPLCAFRCHDKQQTAANRQCRSGEEEGLRLQFKYLPLLKKYRAHGGPAHPFRRALFRSIYFARKKNTVRSAESLPCENALMRELTPAWYAGYWLAHRLTKPLSNLQKAMRDRSPA
jgi:glycosyltransferase involved in cell wall biosynthesis